MTNKIKIIQLGLGPIGLCVSQQILKKHDASLIAAIDLKPSLQGKDIGLLAKNSANHILINSDLTDCIKHHDIDIAVVCTSSNASIVETQITPLLEAGISVVTTCEELFYPWKTQPKLASRLNAIALQNNVTVLSTGVNPGFLMDYLPTAITAISNQVSYIKINRIQDASQRRQSFQEKIGAGLSPSEFARKKAAGTLRHVGLTESAHFIANQLNWTLTQSEETLKPVIVDDQILGVQQTVIGYIDHEPILELNFIATTQQQNSEDSIHISGSPNMHINISPPVNGDLATTALIVNAIPATLKARPGLQNMATINTVSLWT